MKKSYLRHIRRNIFNESHKCRHARNLLKYFDSIFCFCSRHDVIFEHSKFRSSQEADDDDDDDGDGAFLLKY